MKGRGSEIYKRMHRPGTTRWVLNRFDPADSARGDFITSANVCYALCQKRKSRDAENVEV